MFSAVYFVIFLRYSNALLKLDCTGYNITNWNCDKYHFYFSASNLENTLNCIGYTKYKYPNATITLSRKIRKLITVQENDGLIKIYEITDMKYHESVLKLETCDKSEVQFLSPYSQLFWHPDFATSRQTLFKVNFDRITIRQVIQNHFKKVYCLAYKIFKEDTSNTYNTSTFSLSPITNSLTHWSTSF